MTAQPITILSGSLPLKGRAGEGCRQRPVSVVKPIICPILLLALLTTSASACPFCNSVQPTIAQQRESSHVVLLAEATADPKPSPSRQSFRVHKALKGQDQIHGDAIEITPDVAVKNGSLALLLGADPGTKKSPASADLRWTAIPLDEVAYAYVLQAPDLRQSNAKRLAYFARFLENANRVVADDALAEFAQASFDQTAEVADKFPMDRLRSWLGDPQAPAARKGFYGLALGLAKSDQDRATNLKLLKEKILAPADDFRAGFDGILAGYLLLSGRDGLGLIDERYFSNPKAADGDVRHALKAVRFFDQYGKDITPAQLAAAIAHLLSRAEFAGEVLTDLARLEDWRHVDQVAALYQSKAYSDADTRRAIVAYLKACPKQEATTALGRLRKTDPEGIAAAEKYLSALSGGN